VVVFDFSGKIVEEVMVVFKVKGLMLGEQIIKFDDIVL